MHVRINGLTLVTTDGWTTNSDWASRYCTATDGEGRQFPLIHPLYDIGPAPTNRFDAIGVFLQESGSGTDGTFGYQLFVQEVEPSAPVMLAIAMQPATMQPLVTWPGSLSNYQLQSRNALTTQGWTTVTNTPVLTNGQNTVTFPRTPAPQFFRLQRFQ